MLLQRAARLAQGGVWSYELKLDGFRAVAFKTADRVQLRSRNDKDFNARYPAIVKALAAMPDETVIDCVVDLLRVRRDDRRWKGRHERAADLAA